MRGTCLESPPQSVPGVADAVIFSFYGDVKQEAQIRTICESIYSDLSLLVNRAIQQLGVWKVHQNLWLVNKEIAIRNWLLHKPTDSDFHVRLQFFTKTAVTVGKKKPNDVISVIMTSSESNMTSLVIFMPLE